MKELLKKIKAAYEEKGYGYFGVRSDDNDIAEGEMFDASFDWDIENDVRSDDRLDGTCATGLDLIGLSDDDCDDDSIAELTERINFNEKFYGKEHLYIIAGASADCGDDSGELVIRDAVCIGKIK